MRHFCDTSNGPGIFHTIELEGVLTGPSFDEALSLSSENDSVLRELILVLEVNVRDVLIFAEGRSSRLSPSEESVLQELFDFQKMVRKGSEVNRETCFRACFHYTNLNTGKSVVWFVYLEV